MVGVGLGGPDTVGHGLDSRLQKILISRISGGSVLIFDMLHLENTQRQHCRLRPVPVMCAISARVFVAVYFAVITSPTWLSGVCIEWLTTMFKLAVRSFGVHNLGTS